MRLVMSEDGGRTWNRDSELLIYESAEAKERETHTQCDYANLWEDIVGWTFGHPTALLLPDGVILLAYYAGLHDKSMSIHWARIRA